MNRKRIVLTGGLLFIAFVIVSTVIVFSRNKHEIWHAIDMQNTQETMHSVKDWAMAWEWYYVKQNSYLPTQIVYGQPQWGNITASQLMAMFKQAGVEEKYLKDLKENDGWGWPLEFAVGSFGDGEKYFIRSPGKDGKWDSEKYIDHAYSQYAFNSDIVMGNGMWYRWMMIPTAADYLYVEPIPRKNQGAKVIP